MDVSEKIWRMRLPLLKVTLWLFQIAMETGSLIDEKWMIYPSKIVIFHSELLTNQWYHLLFYHHKPNSQPLVTVTLW